MAEAKATKAEVTKTTPRYDDEALSGIQTFGDALNLVESTVGTGNVLVAGDVLGNGFRLLENKDALIDTAFLAISWDFHQGDFGEFVTVHLVTEDDKKYVINDGSAGIRDQLMSVTASKNVYGPMLVKGGLRRSDYEYEDENGKKTPARTYYLNVAA